MGCFLKGPLKYAFLVVVTLDCGHPCFWNFYSAIVVVVETYVSYLFDPMCVPVKVTINRLALLHCKVGHVFHYYGHALQWQRSGYGQVRYL